MDIEYPSTSTANYRGYIASWQIINDNLYLVDLKIPGFKPECDMPGNFFPVKEKTFANCYTGKLRIPYGELLEYVHNGYGSIYEN